MRDVFGLAMFFQFKSETLFRLKFISDSIQVKLCQIEKNISGTTEEASPIPGLLSCKSAVDRV
jgi:hypothetical protein